MSKAQDIHAGILARLVKQPCGHAQMLSSGAVDRILRLLAATMLAATKDDRTWQIQVCVKHYHPNCATMDDPVPANIVPWLMACLVVHAESSTLL